MQCGALMASGALCRRQADLDGAVCSYHRSIAFRHQVRALELARLSADDQDALASAAVLEGLDSEIAVLRVLLRRAAHVGEIDGFRRGLESLRRALLARRRLAAFAPTGRGSTLDAVLDLLGAAAPSSLADARWDEKPDPASVVYFPPSASGPVEPPQEREAAALVLRYQAGEPEALDLLYGLLETAILAVLLHYRDFQPSQLTLPALQHHSRIVLAELAQSWRPGESFLGYFCGGFPTAIARHVGRAQPEQCPATAPNAASAVPAGPVPNPGCGSDVPFSAADLASLPVLERQVVLLRDFAAQSMDAIARQLGLHPSSASRLYRRARGRLAGRTGRPEGHLQVAMRRLVRALHVAANPEGRMPNRSWAMAAAGLKRIEYEQLIARLEAANAIYGRTGRVPGRLADPTPAATLARVGLSPS